MIRRLIGGDRRKEKAVTEMSPESSGQHRTIPFLKRWNAEKNIDRGSVSPTPCSSPARLPPRPQSLDLASFRVVKGNLNEICEKIGVQSIDDLGIPLASWLALKSPSSSKSEFGIRLGPYVLPADGNNTTEHNRASSNTEETVPKERAGDERIEVMGLPAMTSRHLEREETPCHRAYFSACCSFSSSLDDDSSSTTTGTTDSSLFTVSPNGKFRRQIKSWQRGSVLGSGSFGTVYEGISSDGFFFAVKEVSLHGHRIEEQLNRLEHEIAMLSEFQHENIVQYLGSDKFKSCDLKFLSSLASRGPKERLEEDNKLYIFLELVTQKSLASLYRKYHLRDSQVSVYTRQILNGLKYLHGKGVMHRDIKCANILVDANGLVKLADFGLAKQVDKLQMLNSCKGSAYWMAPEVVHPRKSYGLPADIWSFGCTVLEMLTGQVPYAHLEPTAAIFKIGRGEPPSIPCYLSRNARHFIKRCLQVDPYRRPTAADLLEHPFVRSTSTASCPQNEEGQISCQLFP